MCLAGECPTITPSTQKVSLPGAVVVAHVIPGDFPSLETEFAVPEALALGLDLSHLNSLNLFTNPWTIASCEEYLDRE